jgi:hypothetical protein
LLICFLSCYLSRSFTSSVDSCHHETMSDALHYSRKALCHAPPKSAGKWGRSVYR